MQIRAYVISMATDIRVPVRSRACGERLRARIIRSVYLVRISPSGPRGPRASKYAEVVVCLCGENMIAQTAGIFRGRCLSRDSNSEYWKKSHIILFIWIYYTRNKKNVSYYIYCDILMNAVRLFNFVIKLYLKLVKNELCLYFIIKRTNPK